MRIHLENVGRGKLSWVLDLPDHYQLDDIGDAIIRSVRKRRALMSRDITVMCDPDALKGEILAGLRDVGTWRLGEAKKEALGE